MTKFFACMALLILAACAGSPYEEGKSSADVPAHVDTVYLKRVFLYGGEPDDPNKNLPGHEKPATLEEDAPSSNDIEVLALAKANVVSQLTNLGYKIVNDTQTKSDITMEFSVRYMPERWPLVDRSVGVEGRVFSPEGKMLFKQRAYQQNSIGLIGAVVGDSRDEMVAATTREAVVKTVDEMRKGLQEKPSN